MINDYGKIIARNLKRIAYENDRTQSDICRDLGLSDSTVSSWFNGTRIPRMDKIDLLAHYFNCTRADIMEENKPTKRSYYLDAETAEIAQQIFEDRDLHALLDSAKGNSPENLRMVADLLRKLKGTNPDG